MTPKNHKVFLHGSHRDSKSLVQYLKFLGKAFPVAGLYTSHRPSAHPLLELPAV